MPDATLIREVTARYTGPARRLDQVTEPADVARFVRSVLQGDAREHFLAIFLDGRNRPCAWQRVSTGTATASLVHPREVFQPAVLVGAVSLVIAHNHPSGDPVPSPEDASVTRRLAEAGQILGIHLVDHVVVGEPGFVSMRDRSPDLFRA